jgi:hypothetical protein
MPCILSFSKDILEFFFVVAGTNVSMAALG